MITLEQLNELHEGAFIGQTHTTNDDGEFVFSNKYIEAASKLYNVYVNDKSAANLQNLLEAVSKCVSTKREGFALLKTALEQMLLEVNSQSPVMDLESAAINTFSLYSSTTSDDESEKSEKYINQEVEVANNACKAYINEQTRENLNALESAVSICKNNGLEGFDELSSPLSS